jgi:hypothetical protein
MAWGDWVPTEEAYARASGRRAFNRKRQLAVAARRDRVRELLQRWGSAAPAKVKMSRVLGVSLRTINRDVRALQEAPPLPDICPTCHLPSRLDLDASSLTDDPAQLAALERAMARLIGGVEDPETAPRRRPGRPQGVVDACSSPPQGVSPRPGVGGL